MNTKHTPGPTPETDAGEWPSPKYIEHITFEGADRVVLAPEEYEALHESHRELERERDRLKAVNAELLAFAHSVVDFYENGGNDDPVMDSCEWWAKARAAIAKAKGEA